jgi:hypothetical protein
MRVRTRSFAIAIRPAVLAACLLAPACTGRTVELARELQMVDVTTGWFDAGLVEGKNKLVPTIAFRLQNVGPEDIGSVQVNAVFRRKGEQDNWGDAFAVAIPSDGLAPQASTNAIVLRSQLGYTGEQPRAEMLSHSEFLDAYVEVFGKHGGANWVKLGQFDIRRQLLVQ